MGQYLKRFKNVGTIVALFGLGGMLSNQFGYNVDLEWLNNTVNIACSMLVVLGICNNPTTKNIDLPFKKQVDNSEIKPLGEVTDFRG